jgi:asparagine synthetase A
MNWMDPNRKQPLPTKTFLVALSKNTFNTTFWMNIPWIAKSFRAWPNGSASSWITWIFQLEKACSCDSTSVRKGYKGDVTHSAIADQSDYAIHIAKEHCTMDTLNSFVAIIYKIISDAKDMILENYPEIAGPPGHATETWHLPKEVHFITPNELHKEFPDMDSH